MLKTPNNRFIYLLGVSFISLEMQCAQSLSHVQLFGTPWIILFQDPLSMGFFQARILEWVAISFSRGCSLPRCQTHISSVQFSHSAVSSSLQFHGLQQARLPCQSPAPGACPTSCPSSPWCHLSISSFVVPFSFYFQSFPASGTFQMSQFFTSGGQSIGASASASVFPINIQDWFL